MSTSSPPSSRCYRHQRRPESRPAAPGPRQEHRLRPGFYEAITLAFYADADLDALHIAADAAERNVVRIVNPLTSNLTIMRPLLAPSLLNVVVENLKKGNAAGRLFELANVYAPAESIEQLPNETMHLGLAAFGEQEDFFALKGAIEALGAAFASTFQYRPRPEHPLACTPASPADLLCGGGQDRRPSASWPTT